MAIDSQKLTNTCAVTLSNSSEGSMEWENQNQAIQSVRGSSACKMKFQQRTLNEGTNNTTHTNSATYSLFIAHSDILNSLCLSGNSYFSYRNTDDTKDVLHILKGARSYTIRK